MARQAKSSSNDAVRKPGPDSLLAREPFQAPRILVIFFLFILVLPFSNARIVHSQSMEELYRMHFSHAAVQGESAAEVARYWNSWINVTRQQIIAGQHGNPLVHAELLKRIEIAHQPIIGLIERIDQLPEGEQQRDAHVQLMALMDDKTLAQAAFDAMGTEWCTKIVVERVLTELEQANRDQEYSDRTFLAQPAFRKALKLSERQSTDIESILEQAKLDLTELLDQHNQQLRDLADNLWNDLLRVLDERQRLRATELLGKPAHWFYALKSPEFVQEDFRLGGSGKSIHGRLLLETARSIATTPDTLTPDQLRKHGIARFESLVYRMFFNESIWTELECTEEQISQLKGDFRFDLLDRIYVVPCEGAPRLKALVDGTAEYPKELVDFLLPPQMKWFRQIELQVRLGYRYASTVGLLSPEMVAELALKSVQKENLAEIGKQHLANENELVKAKEYEVQQFRDRLQSRLAEVLNDEQRTLYKRLTGRAIEEIAQSSISNR